MDQFSHDLTVALEETSLLDRARVSRWGQQRRRTRSTGNLPCAPQPTEDSSSPTDIAHGNSQSTHPTNTNNNDGLDTQNIHLPSDSDDKEEAVTPRLPCKTLNQTSVRLMGTLESDSLNENFSPARFFKPNARRKRKFKRITMDYEISTGIQPQADFLESSMLSNCLLPGAASKGNIDGVVVNVPHTISGCTGIMRKRVLKPDPNSRSQLFFCGKRKRSNRDRYHEQDHSSSMPRHNNHLDEYRMRPRSFSSTSKPHSDRLLPLNKGLLSKIERISQQQKNDGTVATTGSTASELYSTSGGAALQQQQQQADGTSSTTLEQDTATSYCNTDGETQNSTGMFAPSPIMAGDDMAEALDETPSPQLSQVLATITLPQPQQQQQQQETSFRNHRKKSTGHHNRRRLLQFAVDQHSMDCGELNDFSSSSLSSSDSEDIHAANDTDREGDDELTDWPGNESICGELKYDSKRKLTKRNALPQIKSDPESANSVLMAEDDTVMSNTTAVGDIFSLNWPPSSAAESRSDDLPFQPSEPITIATKTGFSSICRGNVNIAAEDHLIIPLKQIESEMSGETSNPFLSSPPCQPTEVREIRAGCRRVKGERPGFSIKTSVNERLARFLQDPRQLQIRLPDIEIYEHESLLNLATLYSLQMSLENGCAVLNKTSNTTQSVNIDQHSLQSRLLLSDFKRRCYDSKGSELLPK